MNSRILTTLSLSLVAHSVAQDEGEAMSKYKERDGSAGFFIRRNAEDAEIAKVKGWAPDEVAGALFSFSRNFESGIDQTVGRGVVGYSSHYTWNNLFPGNHDRAPSITDYGFSGSVLFDKVDTGGGGEGETDILQFDLGTDFLYDFPAVGPGQIAEGLLVNIKVSNATDFDFDRHIVGGQLDIVPVNGLIGGQMLRQVNWERSPFRLYPNWLLHAEAGTVVDRGAGDTIAGKDEFARVGGKATLGFRFGPYTDPDPEVPTPFKDRLRLNASFLHYEPLTEQTEAATLFSAGLEFRWPDVHHAGSYRASPIAVEVSYREGEIPFVQERDQSLTVGFTVRF